MIHSEAFLIGCKLKHKRAPWTNCFFLPWSFSLAIHAIQITWMCWRKGLPISSLRVVQEIERESLLNAWRHWSWNEKEEDKPVECPGQWLETNPCGFGHGLPWMTNDYFKWACPQHMWSHFGWSTCSQFMSSKGFGYIYIRSVGWKHFLWCAFQLSTVYVKQVWPVLYVCHFPDLLIGIHMSSEFETDLLYKA